MGACEGDAEESELELEAEEPLEDADEAHGYWTHDCQTHDKKRKY